MESLISLRKEYRTILQNIQRSEEAATNKPPQHKSELPRLKAVLLVNLILLHVPWPVIVKILLVATKSGCKVPKMPFNMAALKEIAMNKILEDPSLLTKVKDMSNPGTITANKWICEYNLAAWLLEQNRKGIAVPTSLAWAHYQQMWGWGPHQEAVASHLATLDHWSTAKSWAKRFRRRWNFDHNICPKGAPLSDAERSEKVLRSTLQQCSKKKQFPKSKKKKGWFHFRVRNGFQKMKPDLAQPI